MFGNKKGFAYLIIVTIFVAILLVVFLTYNATSYQERQELVEGRVRTMNNFVQDFNEDIHRATFISAFRALVALEDNIAITGVFLTDAETAFKEVFYNGTLDGSSIVVMQGSTFRDYVERVNLLADDVGILANISVNNISLNQSDPWFIDVVIQATVNVTDVRNTASWSYDESYETSLPIINLRDPVYSYYTSNKVPNTIRISPFAPNFVTGNDTTNLLAHLDGSYYIASNKSPSFLQRFEGNLSPSEFGIESIVDLDSLSSQDIVVYPGRNKVDYLYFTDNASGTLACSFNNVSGTYYFVIDTDRLDLYDVAALSYTSPC